ncbi:MAG: hypothetical protein JWQ69_4104 [Pseudomonas sp.]|nr:hypothetical protein [Pseudomonas sp.]
MTLPSPPGARKSRSAAAKLRTPGRIVSLTAGALLIAHGLRQGGLKGWLQVFMGAGAAWWGYSGEYPLKTAWGHYPSRSINVGRPRAEVFAFCRDPLNLGALIPWIESIEEVAEHTYRWTAFGSLGRPVHWTLVDEVVEVDRQLRWSTRFHGPWQHEVRIRFRDTPGNPGTDIEVSIACQLAQQTPGAALLAALSRFSDRALVNVLSRVKQHLESSYTRLSAPTAHKHL